MRVSLVLSGGGARCFAQIGALKALEEAGVTASAVAGTSTGAILGALYAAGHDAEKLYEIVAAIDYAKLLRGGGGGRGGLIGHEGVAKLLEPHLPETFEALPTPLAVPATDIQRAEMLVFRSGPLLPAVCASNAFPGLFAPVELDGRQLMDGGILDNYPLDLGATHSNDPLLAIDTMPSPTRRLALEAEDAEGWLARLGATLRGELPDLPLIVEVLEKAYTITQSRLIALRSAMFPAEMVIRPALDEAFGIQDFGRLDEAHALGYEAGRRFAERLSE